MEAVCGRKGNLYFSVEVEKGMEPVLILKANIAESEEADTVQFVIRNVKKHVLAAEMVDAKREVCKKLEIPAVDLWAVDGDDSCIVTAELLRGESLLDMAICTV